MVASSPDAQENFRVTNGLGPRYWITFLLLVLNVGKDRPGTAANSYT